MESQRCHADYQRTLRTAREADSSEDDRGESTVMDLELKELQSDFLTALATELRRLGFKASRSARLLSKSTHVGSWLIGIGIIEHESDFDITVDVDVRVDAVEKLVNQDNEWASPSQKLQTATVGVDLGNLADGRQRRWTVRRQPDVSSAVDSIVHEFERFGIPFLERFSNLDTMLEELTSEGPRAWLYSPAHIYRCKTIVALGLLLKGRGGAHSYVETCTKFLAERKDPRLKEFTQFAERLLSDSAGGS